MKILYIIDGMFNSAGRERVVANKAACFSRMGHHVTIVTTNQRGRASYYPLPEGVTMVDFGINYDDYNGKNILSKICAYFQKNRLFRQKLRALVSDDPQDVVVALMDRYLPAVLSLRAQSVTVYEHHFNKFAMYDLRESKTKRIVQQVFYQLKDWYYTRFYYRQLDYFAVLTEEDKEYWGDGFKNMVCMPNSITYHADKRANLDNKIVISVGRLTYQKGYDRLIEVWKDIEKQFPDWQLHIYGDGEDKESLLAQIQAHGLRNVMIFPPTSAIGDKLMDASVYVMSSRFEGLPMVLLESSAVGLPLVSFDCKCGPRDVIVDGDNGFLIPDGNLPLMEERLCHLLGNAELRKTMGAKAKQTALRFSHEEVMKEWITLFERKKKR